MIFWYFQVKYRDEKKWSAILFCGILFLFTLTAIASICFVLSSYKTIETEVKIKTVEKSNTFLSKKRSTQENEDVFLFQTLFTNQMKQLLKSQSRKVPAKVRLI